MLLRSVDQACIWTQLNSMNNTAAKSRNGVSRQESCLSDLELKNKQQHRTTLQHESNIHTAKATSHA